MLAHLIGDFLLQNEWMAFNKQKRWLPLLVHSAVYTIAIAAASFALLDQPLSVYGILLVFAGHIVLDRGSFIAWWYKRVTRCTDPKTWWLKVVYDQTFHLILLYAALQLG
nr:DUF3307 domain-containing protein [Paenibacillus hamazuiensis]